MTPYKDEVICYNCIHWDGDKQWSEMEGIGNVWISICTCNSRWYGIDFVGLPQNEDHITQAADSCKCFEPVEGWDEHWRELHRRRYGNERRND